MFDYVGTSGDFSLFSSGEKAVIVNTQLNLIIKSDSLSTLGQVFDWAVTPALPSVSIIDMVNDHFVASDIEAVLASANRLYTIPGGVQSEAKKALEWHKEHKRGGTPVGMNTARLLAQGGQIGIQKVRHIAKYFPRHEVDKKGKGWEPGEDSFPSNGRIAWALWGGDAAQRWASAIVERENKKALTAAGYELENYQEVPETNLEFKDAHELDENFGPEFIARVRHDGTGIDRLYKVEIDGRVYLWDDNSWDALGSVDGDIYLYDETLDESDDVCEKTHVIVDPSSAIIIASKMNQYPLESVRLEDVDPEEAQLVAEALEGIDWTMVDRAMTAAADGLVNPNDNIDTPAERSQRAAKQVRNSEGEFAKTGQRVAVGGDAANGLGEITTVNAGTNTATVKLDSGKTINVPANQLVPEEVAAPAAPSVTPIDTSGILGESKDEKVKQPVARLPEGLTPLTDKEVHALINDFPKYVTAARGAAKAAGADETKGAFSSWGQKNLIQKTAIVSAGTEPEKDLTPDTSDVTPKYLAIIPREDPQSVLDLVAIVPATATSTQPVTYKRKDQKWVRDDQIFSDLTSPTPPDVIELDNKAVLDDVLQQMDGIKPISASASLALLLDKDLVSLVASLSAAGGLDRNRGNAEELRQYWLHGKGAAKIRWGTPGDWTRCVRQLSKYMGIRAKGYCQLRHKEATGVYTGSPLNPGHKDGNFSVEEFDTAVIESSILAARAQEAKERFSGIVASAGDSGASFRIPLLIPENLESGDGRKFNANAIDIRDLPLPLMWQIKTGEGHNGSVVVGRIDHMERTPDGIGNAYGVFDTGAYGKEAERLVRNGFIRGVSADLDQFEAKEDKPENAEDNEQEDVSKQKLTINHARVMAATIVAKPAFQECAIYIEDGDSAAQEI